MTEFVAVRVILTTSTQRTQGTEILVQSSIFQE
ncbi:hypothetical protein NIES2100_03420 [Calothrix sp. NIES-2100]|nr:hypothetical protein NIES2100_03420 [Calothrix sp. NIES-2100]